MFYWDDDEETVLITDSEAMEELVLRGILNFSGKRFMFQLYSLLRYHTFICSESEVCARTEPKYAEERYRGMMICKSNSLRFRSPL
jgi:hypothetical protein